MVISWRPHTHIHVHTQLAGRDEQEWERLFERVAEAAHELDEEVSVTGSLREPRYPHLEVTAFRMRRRAVDALRDRMVGAVGSTTIVRLERRCWCR